MEYRRFENTIVARLDRGEEITAQLKLIAQKAGVRLGMVNALGAVDDFTVGVYNVAEQKYYKNHFAGAYEIVSLHGNISEMDGECYLHLHMSAGDAEGHVVGGHLNEARISATCEIFITCLEGSVGRKKDAVTGLNLYDFTK
ncbi:MAG: DNA-binding protein [Faecalibacterium sp.]|jgi:predicted DNA-binding protein with PD1-like motif|nr:DNA-binding protein [Faecalibacterium sp.]